MSFPHQPRVQVNHYLGLINYHKLRRSRLSMNNREWDDEDTAGEPQSVVQLSVTSDAVDA